MFIRDYVTAQEHLSGLQPKRSRNALFNRREICSKKTKSIKKYIKSAQFPPGNHLRGTDNEGEKLC
jgi:hypothetical protein